jgi:hypothetical protein
LLSINHHHHHVNVNYHITTTTDHTPAVHRFSLRQYGNDNKLSQFSFLYQFDTSSILVPHHIH